MKLSELLELGITVVKETHGWYLTYEPDGTPCGCLIGTACYAMGYRKEAAAVRRDVNKFIKANISQAIETFVPQDWSLLAKKVGM